MNIHTVRPGQTHTHTHTHIHTYTHTQVQTHAGPHTCRHTHLHTQTHTCTHSHSHIQTHTCFYSVKLTYKTNNRIMNFKSLPAYFNFHSLFFSSFFVTTFVSFHDSSCHKVGIPLLFSPQLPEPELTPSSHPAFCSSSCSPIWPKIKMLHCGSLYNPITTFIWQQMCLTVKALLLCCLIINGARHAVSGIHFLIQHTALVFVLQYLLSVFFMIHHV